MRIHRWNVDSNRSVRTTRVFRAANIRNRGLSKYCIYSENYATGQYRNGRESSIEAGLKEHV